MQKLEKIPRVGKRIWSIEVSSSNEERLETLQRIQQFLAEKNIQVSLADYEFMLIMDEAITNAMEHGNQWDATKRVAIEFFQWEENLLIYIRDSGIGFDVSTVAEKMSQRFHFSPRGRGIFIISNFCDVQWNSLGNEICMKIAIKKNHNKKQ